MSAGDVLSLVSGAGLAVAGLWVLVRFRAVAESFAGLESGAARHSLLNRERVERIQASVDHPGTRVLDRAKAIFLGVCLVMAGVGLVVGVLQ